MAIFLDFLQVKSTQVFIRDSSMVHPVALICFSGKDVCVMHHGVYGYFDNITLESVCQFMRKNNFYFHCQWPQCLVQAI